jgi:hypothetical protein
MKAGVAQLVASRGPEAAGRIDIAREVERRDNRRPLRAAAVTNGMRVPVDLLGREGGLRHPQQVKHKNLDGRPGGQACDDLDQPAEQVEPVLL